MVVRWVRLWRLCACVGWSKSKASKEEDEASSSIISSLDLPPSLISFHIACSLLLASCLDLTHAAHLVYPLRCTCSQWSPPFPSSPHTTHTGTTIIIASSPIDFNPLGGMGKYDDEDDRDDHRHSKGGSSSSCKGRDRRDDSDDGDGKHRKKMKKRKREVADSPSSSSSSSSSSSFSSDSSSSSAASSSSILDDERSRPKKRDKTEKEEKSKHKVRVQ